MDTINKTGKTLFIGGTVILSLHILGFALLLTGSASVNQTAILLGSGATAYLLGIRHAFDADHIAAIDNTVRRISLEKRDASLVGMFFGLGHSTVVLGAGIAVALGFTAIADMLNDDTSALKSAGAIVGGLTAGSFLILIAIINTVFLIKLFKSKDDHEGSSPKGILTTLFAPLVKNIDKPWKMYPLGVLFGLGFDTATSIALLALAGGAILSLGQSVAIIALPIIFMAGITLGDTLDSILMSRAYNHNTDVKKRRVYILTITIVSIIAALVVGLPIFLTTIGAVFGITFPTLLSNGIEFEYLGIAIVAILLSIWLLSSIYRRITKPENGTR